MRWTHTPGTPVSSGLPWAQNGRKPPAFQAQIDGWWVSKGSRINVNLGVCVRTHPGSLRTVHVFDGAGDGNRTHVRSLGSFYTAIVRRPLTQLFDCTPLS